MTTEAVIVSTARTGVGKAYRGALNNTEGPTLAGHVMAEAVKRAGIAPGEVEDVVKGCAMLSIFTRANPQPIREPADIVKILKLAA